MSLAFNQAHSFRTPSKRSCGPRGKTHQLSIEHRLDASPAQALREMLEPGFKGWVGAYLGSVTEGLALARAQEKGDREFWLFLSWLWVNGTLCYQKWYRCAFLLKQGIRNLLLNVATDMKSICFLHACFINDLKKDQRESQNWIYRSPLFLPSHLKSLGHLRLILWTDLVHCPQEDLSDQWAHWHTPGTAILPCSSQGG